MEVNNGVIVRFITNKIITNKIVANFFVCNISISALLGHIRPAVLSHW